MTTTFNGREFATTPNSSFKTPFEGTHARREKNVASLIARRQIRRARRDIRSI